MAKHTIRLQRNGILGFLSAQSIGTDALNALHSIPDVKEVEIVEESADQVELTFIWDGEGVFVETGDYLSKNGLCRAEVNE